VPLSANSRLGPYEIRSTLGVGGMGEVYRAYDPRLHRDVAIKVLREEGAIDDNGRIRFEREARAVASLSHPNIVGVHDFGVANGQQYIVQELVEGESLRSLLKGKPLPLRKLMEIGTQIADGLAAAHGAAIVHRDLKPENVMLAKDGRVRILDFGLARQGKTTPSINQERGKDLDVTATLALDHGLENITRAGVVIGTANYMSPEQALGKPSDYRSDQFSFGLILYELASGKRAFTRPSSVETMAAIVNDEAPALDEKLSPPLRWIIDRCLQKDPGQRYESTRDLHRELRDLRNHLSEAFTSSELAPITLRMKKSRWKMPAIYASFLLLAGLVYLLRPQGQHIGNYRYSPFAKDAGGAIWSPDGKAVAYTQKVNGSDQVFLRYLNSPIPLQLTHTKGTPNPLGWSSDRNHLIVGEQDTVTNTDLEFHQKLYSVPLVGGERESILDTTCMGCDLSRNGKVYATLTSAWGKDGAVGISDPLGSPLREYKPDSFTSSKEEIDSNPSLSFSPDGKKILIFLPLVKHCEVWLLPYPMGSQAPRKLHMLDKFPFHQAAPTASWMPDSEHVVLSFAPSEESIRHLWMANIDSNNLEPLTTGTTEEVYPSVSADGRSILYVQSSDHYDLVSVSVGAGAARTFITTDSIDTGATWSENAKMAWVSSRNGRSEIWIRLPDGSERPTVTDVDFKATELKGSIQSFMSPALSPDGTRLIYAAAGPQNDLRLWISSLSGGAPARLTNAGAGSEWGGSWSPDGTRFVYFFSQAGKPASLMMVKTTANAAPVLLRDNLDDFLPAWSPDGKWIAFHDHGGWNLISPDVKTLRPLGKIETPYFAFSKDAKLLYGIHTGSGQAFWDRAVLFSLDPLTLRQNIIKDLGHDLMPQSPYNPGIRFSLAPDGKSLVYSTYVARDDLWMLQGYRQPTWSARISDALQRK
jgi:serine/threonine protein kinase